jgi:hypothetical protein
MHIIIEPIPANPGYTATVSGSDPERDPTGVGLTRMSAALDLARGLLDTQGPTRIAVCLAIAAVLREELETTLPGHPDPAWQSFASGMERAAKTVEGIW